MTNQNSAAQAAQKAIRAAITLLDGDLDHENAETMRTLLSKLRAPVADERAALQKLVDLEDMRLRLRALHENGHGTDYDHYHKALPAAWEAARAALASAPVAGEAQPVAWLHQCRKKPELATVTMNKREPTLAAKGYRPIPLYAAPQASAEDDEYRAALARITGVAKALPDREDVRNAALDQAAAVAKRISDKYAFGHYGNETDTADEIEREILALKTQADKDGCTCPSGDGSLRHPCSMHPGVDKDGAQQRNWVSDWSAAIKSLPMGRSEGVVDKSPNLQGSSVDRSTDLQDRGDDVVLPPLPSPPVHRGHALFAGSQMQTYARAAVLADRQQRAGDALPDYTNDPRHHVQYRIGWNHCVDAYRAALSATQAEQGERDA